MRLKSSNDGTLDFCSRNTCYRSAFSLPSSQRRRADVESVADAVLGGKARAHEVALVIEQLALEQGAAFGALSFPAGGIRLQQRLHALEGLPVDDGFVLALKPGIAVMNLTDIDPVLQKVGEGTVTKRNAAIVFGDFGVSPLGDDAPAVEIGHQFAEGLQFEVAA